jgi:hypothetical protein
MQRSLLLPVLFFAAVGSLAPVPAYAWTASATGLVNVRLAGRWEAAQALNVRRLGEAPLDQPEFILDDAGSLTSTP